MEFFFDKGVEVNLINGFYEIFFFLVMDRIKDDVDCLDVVKVLFWGGVNLNLGKGRILLIVKVVIYYDVFIIILLL